MGKRNNAAPPPKPKKKRGRKVFLIILIFLFIIALAALTINLYVKSIAKDNIITPEEAEEKNVDCILVLGAGLKADGTPSDILADRLKTAVALYQSGVSDRLLMSGDHGRTSYNEVRAMRDYAISCGIPADNIFMDHAGFSTYESIYRAKAVFDVKSAVIVTQKYHLYRALYIAEKLKLDAYGVTSDIRNYQHAAYRETREIIARDKDFFYVLFDVQPTYLGDVIPISGNGSATED